MGCCWILPASCRFSLAREDRSNWQTWRSRRIGNYFYSQAQTRVIQVQLVGGIGNQLFQYYLGKYLSIYKNSKLAFVQPPPNKSHDLSSIEDFFTPETYLRKTSSPNYKDRILRKTINWFPKLESNFLPYLHNFESKKVGMDSSVLKLSSKVNIHGYFQKYYFYEKCIELGL